MKSDILSQFQNSMYELTTFGRGKDKIKRKAKQTLGKLGVVNTKDAQKNKSLKLAGALGAGVAGALGTAALIKNKGKIGAYAKGYGMMAKGAAKGASQKANEVASKAGSNLKTIVDKAKQTAMNATAKGDRIVNKRATSKKVAGLLPESKPKSIRID